MSVIREGDALYAPLVRALEVQRGELVEHLGVFYRLVRDGEDIRFSEVIKKAERSTLGKPDKHHRAPYPPENIPNESEH